MSREPLLPALLFWMALALLPLAAPSWLLGQLAQHLCYGLLAMSLAYLWGQGGLLSFCQALFFGVGAYAYALAGLGKLPLLPTSPTLGLLLALLLPTVLAVGLGLLLVTARVPTGPAWAVLTLVLGVIGERLAVASSYLGGSNGLAGLPPLTLPHPHGPVELVDPLPTFLVLLVVAAVVQLGLARKIASARGSLLRAVREDALRAAHLGIDPVAVRLRAFALGAAVAGLGGGLFAAQFGFVAPSLLGLGLSTETLVWVAVGGRGSPLATLAGALLVKTVEGLLGEWLGAGWPLALGLLLLLVVLFFPQGVFGGLLARLARRERP
jgi:branched-chain amino acid transport system permease protein/urea transport system permease protein